jgi:AcrR family transcriptional regulator
MPMDTFLRLPEEKRNRFLNAAWKEFTHTSFADVSINKIVHQAGIPRGSFYQYFADKRDLFVYLIEDMHERFLSSYAKLVAKSHGDLFKTQLLAFDSFQRRPPECDPYLDRCLRLLRINPGIDLQKMLEGNPGNLLLAGVVEQLDTSALRQQNSEFVRHVFSLTVMALGSAIMDSLMMPERCEEYRRDLESRLEIIQRGCLRPCDPVSVGTLKEEL